MNWMELALIAGGIIAAIMLMLRALQRSATRRSRDPDETGPANKPHRAERLHRQVTDYRASGALPRWDP